MTLGELYAGKPPVQFDEGRDWDRILTTAVGLTPLSQSRLLYSAERRKCEIPDYFTNLKKRSPAGGAMVTHFIAPSSAGTKADGDHVSSPRLSVSCRPKPVAEDGQQILTVPLLRTRIVNAGEPGTTVSDTTAQKPPSNAKLPPFSTPTSGWPIVPLSV